MTTVPSVWTWPWPPSVSGSIGHLCSVALYAFRMERRFRPSKRTRGRKTKSRSCQLPFALASRLPPLCSTRTLFFLPYFLIATSYVSAAVVSSLALTCFSSCINPAPTRLVGSDIANVPGPRLKFRTFCAHAYCVRQSGTRHFNIETPYPECFQRDSSL